MSINALSPWNNYEKASGFDVELGNGSL